MTDRSNIHVLVIGPDKERSQGGIATVTNSILNDQTLSQCICFEEYPSYIDGQLLKRAAFSLRRELRFRFQRHDADVYHVHVAYGTSFWRKRRYVKSLGADASCVVFHIHGSRFKEFWEGLTPRQQDKVRSLLASVGKVIVLSPEWRDFFIEQDLCDPQQIAVLPNAVPLPVETLTDYTNANILFMGRLCERKAPDVLLSAAALVLKAHPEAHFTFAGDGNVEVYEKMARDLGISDACNFLGWVKDDTKESVYLSHSIYCLPSRAEGLPMSVLEAMSYGLATVATPVGGIPDVIEEGKTGFLVPVDDPEALANILIRLIDDMPLKQQIGQQGRQLIEDTYSMEKYANSLMKIYEEVTG